MSNIVRLQASKGDGFRRLGLVQEVVTRKEKALKI